MGAALLVALAAATVSSSAAAEGSPWRLVSDGLEVAELVSPVPATVGDSRVVVVRVDPTRYEFRLLSAKLLKLDSNPTAQGWVLGHGLTGAINASMYQEDHRTAVSYMRDGPGIVNGRWTRDNAVFVAGPMEAGLPPVQILDRTCQEATPLADRYRVAVQNIRMLDCAAGNTWSPQKRSWSTACVGTDREGRVLLIHCRSPYTTHDFIEILRKLPLGLTRLMYVEGGPEASLYVRHGGKDVVRRVGSFETGFREDDGNQAFWPIPNVLGFAPRSQER